MFNFKLSQQVFKNSTKSVIMPVLKKPFSTSSPKGDLFKFQSQLPKLPVPSLEETSAKYLKTVEPFLNQEQLESTKEKVAEFVKAGGAGEILQARLNQFATDKDNWLAEFWDDYAYMSYRDPVVPYVSYFFSHKDVNNIIGQDQLLSKGEIYSYLQEIKNDSTPKGLGLGALTSLNRDEWLSAYNNLLQSPINQASLESIFASSFVIALDSNNPVTIEEKSKNCWHGDGQNRFFDKPLEFFVSANGNSGFLGEHSRMDATPTVQLNNTIYKQIIETDPNELITEIGTSSPRFGNAELLTFDINPTTRANIKDAIAKFDKTIAAHDEEIFQHYGYGKGLIKKFKVSPDAYVQLMMQLAYFKYTGKIRPTYESAATRKFLKGRTETGRTVSNESKKFVETWSDPNASNADKVATFQAAAKQHVSYLSAAADGKGVDRHLFGLKQMLKPGEPIPSIFSDPIFTYSQTWYISSSQVPSEYFQSWGWSQVIDDGFGLAYLINNDWIHVHISCKRGNGLQSDHLKWYLVESANEMKDILTKGLLTEAKPKL
ncbi:Carnitine O-acetyltransferase, mitochondrial [Candida tropicalis]